MREHTVVSCLVDKQTEIPFVGRENVLQNTCNVGCDPEVLSGGRGVNACISKLVSHLLLLTFSQCKSPQVEIPFFRSDVVLPSSAHCP